MLAGIRGVGVVDLGDYVGPGGRAGVVGHRLEDLAQVVTPGYCGQMCELALWMDAGVAGVQVELARGVDLTARQGATAARPFIWRRLMLSSLRSSWR